eukprot:1188130-Prorocentrum_minimum.AAC.4
MSPSVATMNGAMGTMARIRITRKGSNVRSTNSSVRPHCTGAQGKRIGAALPASTCSFALGAQRASALNTDRRPKGSFSKRGMNVQCAAGPRKVCAPFPFAPV